jgi:hypothetical protein
LARWISPDSAGAIADLNLYVYVGNNPLKYRDPTGHVKETPEQEVLLYALLLKYVLEIDEQIHLPHKIG